MMTYPMSARMQAILGEGGDERAVDFIVGGRIERPAELT